MSAPVITVQSLAPLSPRCLTCSGTDGESLVLPPRKAEHMDGPEARRRVEMQMKFNKASCR